VPDLDVWRAGAVSSARFKPFWGKARHLRHLIGGQVFGRDRQPPTRQGLNHTRRNGGGKLINVFSHLEAPVQTADERSDW